MALCIQNEGAAFDAEHFFAIHIFFFDDIEQAAHGFILIRQERHFQRVFAHEFLMAGHAVARYAGYLKTERLKFGQKRAEFLRFGGAAGRAVFGVEIQHQRQVVGGGEIVAVLVG